MLLSLRSKSPKFLIAILVLSFFLIAANPLQEASGDILIYVQLAMAAFAALIGWPALLSTVIVAAQYFGWISAAVSDTVMFWANAVLFVVVLVLALLGKIDLVNQIDSTLGNIASLLTYVLIILGVPLGFKQSKDVQKRFHEAAFVQKGLMARDK
jgi:hypothetical protein